MAKMNSTNLYITTNQIILKADPKDPSTWQDLYRLAPYLRNSLCCVVCGNLLVDPQTPALGKCQHHLCKKCKGGRKKIKPTCLLCKDCTTYTENKTLRILLQCYKKMCMMLINSGIFRHLIMQASNSNVAAGVERGAGNLVMLIREGAAFQDDYQINGGLSKSVYSILPCIYTNSSTQTLQLTPTENANRGVILNSNMQNFSTNGNALYSVMYAGTGNKITIKRKQKEVAADPKTNRSPTIKKDSTTKTVFKKPVNKTCTILKSRRGCRCGNATATPGKLTCCGQRCPCYVDSKPCVECKCRGCRNPHMADGNKVRSHSSQAVTIPSVSVGGQVQRQQIMQNSNLELEQNLTVEQLNNHVMIANIKMLDSCTELPPSLPHALIVNNDERSDNEDEEITVDV